MKVDRYVGPRYTAQHHVSIIVPFFPCGGRPLCPHSPRRRCRPCRVAARSASDPCLTEREVQQNRPDPNPAQPNRNTSNKERRKHHQQQQRNNKQKHKEPRNTQNKHQAGRQADRQQASKQSSKQARQSKASTRKQANERASKATRASPAPHVCVCVQQSMFSRE